MKVVFYILIIFICVTGFSQTEDEGMIFHSRKELNQFRFGNSDLNNLTSGYFLDQLEEFTSEQIDTFLMEMNYDTTHMYGLLNTLNLVEASDVSYTFERDSILFPVLDHYMSIYPGKTINIPLFVIDLEMSRLTEDKRSAIDAWSGQAGYSSFNQSDMLTEDIFYTSLFRDTLHNDNIAIYWDETTFLSNKNRSITSIQITIGTQVIDLPINTYLDLYPYLSTGHRVETIKIQVTFSDNNVLERICDVDFDISLRSKNANQKDNFGDYKDYIPHPNGTELHFTYLYGCEDGTMHKPYILVAGWGAFTDLELLINNQSGFPSTENDLYGLMNQAGFVDNLRQVGYDVVIARFLPPNADAKINAELLIELIKKVNNLKNTFGSYEENIIQGYSAGAIAVRLALEMMEKEHLENNGPHPHTKLYVSVEGEQKGANIPLAAQHSVEHLQQFQMNFVNSPNFVNVLTVYGLHYILNAPLSKCLLTYDYHQTGNYEYPGQGHDELRTHLSNALDENTHDKNLEVALPGYPCFNRNIVLTNGANESSITGSTSDHFPFPTSEGYIPFKQLNGMRKWHTALAMAGGNTVFKYEYKLWPWSSWTLQKEARTNNQCMVLDNAPGGIMWTYENPLTTTMEMMDKMISGTPDILNEHTLFSFTPTLYTVDIRNFNPAANNYRMNYSLKQNKLMFQHLSHINSIDSASNYWGYPHLAYPYSHYWEVTPFDAVFSWSVNTEHNLFTEVNKDNPNDGSQPWVRVFSPVSGIVKNFLMDESDYFNAFIQNRRYGWNARDNFVYKAAIIVPNEIYVGKDVTQRTDFKVVEFLANSDITLQAGKEIHIMPGTDIQAGATFHSYIAPYYCDYFKSGMALNNSEQAGNQMNERLETIPVNTVSEEAEKPFTIYPNPSEGLVNIRNDSKKGRNFEYIIYDLNGNELMRGESNEVITSFEVLAGVYIVKINNYENSYSYKVFVR